MTKMIHILQNFKFSLLSAVATGTSLAVNDVDKAVMVITIANGLCLIINLLVEIGKKLKDLDD